jgi:30S ribosomal protein S31
LPALPFFLIFTSPTNPLIKHDMGKGDKKTRRGKLFSGSYGTLRPRKHKRSLSVVSSTRKPAAKLQDKPVKSPKQEKAEEPKIIEETPEKKPAAKKASPKKTEDPGTEKDPKNDNPEIKEESKEGEAKE